MTRIWFDPLTPKQALFCSKIGERFETQGFDVIYTTRDYPEVTGKLKLLGLSAEVIGKHGGADRFKKLIASAERIKALAEYVNSKAIDLAFSFASPEGARVAYGLGIPYFTANDSPHSRFVANLTIPYAISLFTPWIMVQIWSDFEVSPHRIIPYHGLDPVAWLQDFTLDTKVFSELGLSPNSEYVVIRPEETQASYLHEHANEREPVTNPVITAIAKEYPALKIVVLCRYPGHRKATRECFGDSVIIPDGVVDATSLLSSAQLLVGAGGTMNQEASLLGIPVISCFPGDHLATDQFLAKKKLLYRILNPDDVARKAVEILGNIKEFKDAHRKRAQKLMQEMENPAEIIYTHLLSFATEKLKKS
ncbi:MAG: DUF354 domain-containing protein [Promethearchaeota archaeon]